MNVLATLLKMMVLGLGVLMLVGGGLCGIIMVAEMGKTGGGGWELLIVAGVVGSIGWVLTRAMIGTFRRPPVENPPGSEGEAPAHQAKGDDSWPGGR